MGYQNQLRGFCQQVQNKPQESVDQNCIQLLDVCKMTIRSLHVHTLLKYVYQLPFMISPQFCIHAMIPNNQSAI